jgi:OOP family OmpA-OmpF porin
MNKLLSALAALTLTGVCASSFAAEPVATKNVYLGLDVGESIAGSTCDGIPAGISCSNTATAFRGLAGYQFSPNWAVEVHYTDFGTDNISGSYFGVGVDGQYKAIGEEVAFALLIPLNQQFSLTGRLGVASTKVTTSINAVGLTVNASSTKATAAGGFGVRFQVNDTFGVGLNYDYYGKVGDSNTTGTTTLSTLTAGVLVLF